MIGHDIRTSSKMFLQSFRPNEGLATWRISANWSGQIGPQSVRLFPHPTNAMICSHWRNPKNYFMEVEQAAYSPLNLIPGIEPSPDKILQGRLFIYGDAHRHRLGPNFNLIPANKPRCPFRHYGADGPNRSDDNNGLSMIDICVNELCYWPVVV